MSVPITVGNVRAVYSTPTPTLRELLPQVFEELRKPKGHLAEDFGSSIPDINSGIDPRWSPFQETCVECGVVETLVHLVRNERPDLHIPVYSAMSAIARLAKAGSKRQRDQLMERLPQQGILELCLDRAKNNPLAVHRFAALNVLRAMNAELSLGNTLSAHVAADVICQLCDAALTDPERISRELGNSATTWQSQMMLGKIGVPSAIASKYGKRWFGMSQENCLYAAQFLLCRDPPPSSEFCFDIVKHRPDVIDKLLDRVVVPKYPWYPENDFDSVAAECLALLLQFPLRGIAGLPMPGDGPTTAKREAEWKASVSALRVLYSRQCLLDKILSVWKRLEDETYSKVERMLARVVVDWHAAVEPEPDEMQTLWDCRAHIRISMLRLMIGITYVDTVTDADLVSLLRIAYFASSKIPSEEATSLRGVCEHAEHSKEIFNVPQWVDEFEPDSIEAPSQIASESVTGPTTLLRLLLVLAKRVVLEQVAGWTALPEGTAPSTSLSPAVLDKILPIALKRVTARRETGNMRLRRDDWWYARTAYRSAAELAVCLVEFDKATNGRWASNIRGATKELVVCLGSAAETSNRVKEFEQADRYALAAVQIGEGAPPGEEITQVVIEKNKRRSNVARSHLRRT